MADIQVGQGTAPSALQTAKADARAAIKQQYIAAMDDLTTNWDGLTQAAKAEALRTMVIVLAKAVRWFYLSRD